MSKGACRSAGRSAPRSPPRSPAFSKVLVVGIAALVCACAPGGEAGGLADEAHLSTAALSLEWTYEDRLVASDGVSHDQFGAALALSGNKAVVGAQGGPAGSKKGAAYVFARGASAWGQEAKLAVEGAVAGDNVGAAVALSGDTALVGAPRFTANPDPANPNTGRVHVFTFDGATWDMAATLVAADGTEAVGFGAAVALSGDIAVVGAPRDNEHGAWAGAVHVFERSESVWTEKAKFTALDTEASDQFGGALAISGDTLVVGAPAKGGGAGAAYVFVWNGSAWEEQATLSPGDGNVKDGFGGTVSLSGTRAAVGSPFGDGNEYNTGAVYVFAGVNGTWDLEAKLVATDGEKDDIFGGAVALHEDTLVVGSKRDDDQAENAGAVYVFDRSGVVWKQQKKLAVAGGVKNDYVGSTVAMSGGAILSGSGFVDAIGGDSGAVYVFELRGEVGVACGEGGQCASGFCVSDVCCATECSGADMACSAATKGSGSDGVCGPVVDGSGGVTSAGGASGSTSTGAGGSTSAGAGGGGANAGGTGAGGVEVETSYYSCAAAPGLPGSGVGSFGAVVGMVLAARARRRRPVGVR